MIPIRVLQILPAINFCGGIENYVMNYYRNINREKIQFDFITHTDLESSFKDEILSLGGKIYEFPIFKISNVRQILKKIDEFFKENKDVYKTIHCHMANAAYFYFKTAKKYGIKSCILHSHQNKGSDKLFNNLRNIPLLFFANNFATERVACSELAGKFLFKKKSFKIIRNAIDVNRFKFNKFVREKIRKELNIENKFVVGHVGRYTPQKNQSFLIRIFNELIKKERNNVLILIGSGEDESKLKILVNKLNLQEKVIFLPTQKNIADYYNAFDVFVLPSLYEGLPVSGVEAQANGLFCLFSDTISKEVLICNSKQLSLNSSPDIWSDNILEKIKFFERKDCSENIHKFGYDINYEAKNLEDFYLSLYE